MALPALPYPFVNGHRFGPQSCEFTFNGLKMIAVSEFNYSDTLEPGELRGTSPYILGTTVGTYKAQADFTMPELELIRLLASLKIGQNGGVGEQRHMITMMMAESGFFSRVDVIASRIKGLSAGVKMDGSDAIMTKVDLHVQVILRNGLALAQPRGVAV